MTKPKWKAPKPELPRIDGPTPIEHGPGINPIRRSTIGRHTLGKPTGLNGMTILGGVQLLPSIRMEPELNDPLDVITQGLDVQVQDKECVVHEQSHDHEEHAHHEARFRESSNAHAHTWHRRYGGHRRDTPNNNDLQIHRGFQFPML